MYSLLKAGSVAENIKMNKDRPKQLKFKDLAHDWYKMVFLSNFHPSLDVICIKC